MQAKVDADFEGASRKLDIQSKHLQDIEEQSAKEQDQLRARLKEQIETSTAARQSLLDEQQRLQSSVNDLTFQLERSRMELKAAGDSVETLTKVHNSTLEENRRWQDKHGALSEQVAALQAEISELRSQLKRLQEPDVAAENEVCSQRLSMPDVSVMQSASLKLEIQMLKGQLRDKSQECDRSNNQILQLNQTIADLRAELKSLRDRPVS